MIKTQIKGVFSAPLLDSSSNYLFFADISAKTPSPYFALLDF